MMTWNTSSGAGADPAQEILLLAMKAGQIQLENGAEIFRVEDTIMHICRAYGLQICMIVSSTRKIRSCISAALMACTLLIPLS